MKTTNPSSLEIEDILAEVAQAEFEQIVPRLPDMPLWEMPSWHHHHSHKVRYCGYYVADCAQNRSLVLRSNVVEVEIHRALETSGWIFEYKIRQSMNTFFSGKVWMSVDDLKTAFGLSNKCKKMWGQGMLDSYGGDVAYQGKYIRYQNFLNVPGPGTGNDGDPNVSIHLNDAMKEALKDLIE